MRKPQTIIAEEVQPAKPSARRYYVWQAAMWFTIVHATLVSLGVPVYIYADWFGFRGLVAWDTLTRGGLSYHTLASFLVDSPCLATMAGVMLVPVAAIACYRASMGKRAWVWLTVYWVVAVTICGMMVSSHAVYWLDAYARARPMAPPEVPVWRWLRPGLFCCVFFLSSLPVLLLAALLTIERKKRPPALEAGA